MKYYNNSFTLNANIYCLCKAIIFYATHRGTPLLLIAIIILPYSNSLATNPELNVVGRIIENKAILSTYENYFESNLCRITIDRFVDTEILDQNSSSPINVQDNTKEFVFIFEIENLANDSDQIAFEMISDESNHYELENISLFEDSDSDLNFDPQIDQEISISLADSSLKDYSLALDSYESKYLFIVADIPETSSEQILNYTLRGTSELSQTESFRTDLSNRPEEVDSVLGSNLGTPTFQLSMQVEVMPLVISKNYEVLDNPYGNTQVTTGAIILCTLEVTSKTQMLLENILIEDTVPREANYIPNSLKLDDVSLTDAADSDSGTVIFQVGNLQEISVELNTFTLDEAPKTITFEMQIN